MSEFPIEEWWTPVQLETATNTTRTWRLATFKPKDMILEPLGSMKIGHKGTPNEKSSPQGSVVPGGWDHEHCELCFARIAAIEGCSDIGYTDGNKWLCENCYAKYLSPRLTRQIGDDA